METVIEEHEHRERSNIRSAHLPSRYQHAGITSPAHDLERGLASNEGDDEDKDNGDVADDIEHAEFRHGSDENDPQQYCADAAENFAAGKQVERQGKLYKAGDRGNR